MHAAAERLAERIGPLSGQRVVVIAPNVPALVVSMLAGWRCGGVVVPLSARLREHELARASADAEPAVVVSVRAHMGYSFAELLPRLVSRLPSVRTVLVVDELADVEDELDAHPSTEPQPLDSSIAAILYTSGSTGVPKGALVTHLREVERAPQLAEALELTRHDRAVFVLPVAHAFGLTALLATLTSGGVAVLVDGTFSPEPLLRAVGSGTATVVHGSPSLFTSLLKARPRGIAGLRAGLVGGASSPPGLIEELDRHGLRLLNVYGLTETGVVACCRLDDPPERRYSTAGRLLPTLDARLVDGELEVRGPHVTPGYHRRPVETEAAFRDGWLRTGDLAAVDADGSVRITGRKKDLVHVGGFNVVPAEVEGVLAMHPDVEAVAVVGVPHARMGEVLEAFVVARADTTLEPGELLRFARPRIAGYKLPYSIRFVSQLPVLASGKPDRVALRTSVTA